MPIHEVLHVDTFKGVDPGNLTPEQFSEVYEALYKHSALLFRNVALTPEQQYALTKAFDPESESYGPRPSFTQILKTIPRVPQVQLIGNGMVYDHEGLESAALKHPSHTTFHKTRCQSGQGRSSGMMTGTGDELPVPLGTTAFVSGKTMFDMLPREYKSLAVRTKVRYAPHPYVWMAPARAMPTGLGIETEGLELPLNELPPWEESKVKTFPMVWKNPVTGELHFQIPLPEGVKRDGALYPDGAHLKELNEVRSLLYKFQRPAIAPQLVYPHDWQERDLVLFHNRGVLHTVVGVFEPDQVRAFHQCNLAASDVPQGPSAPDVLEWA
ncbi:Clavaminate synthase-like protein [Pisolithus croceorrhizus]|nr:Clavaminate synthase-like protein [Pisolithus croceorrhizus]